MTDIHPRNDTADALHALLLRTRSRTFVAAFSRDIGAHSAPRLTALDSAVENFAAARAEAARWLRLPEDGRTDGDGRRLFRALVDASQKIENIVLLTCFQMPVFSFQIRNHHTTR
jgi:hypothetical protein